MTASNYSSMLQKKIFIFEHFFTQRFLCRRLRDIFVLSLYYRRGVVAEQFRETPAYLFTLLVLYGALAVLEHCIS